MSSEEIKYEVGKHFSELSGRIKDGMKKKYADKIEFISLRNERI